MYSATLLNNQFFGGADPHQVSAPESRPVKQGATNTRKCRRVNFNPTTHLLRQAVYKSNFVAIEPTPLASIASEVFIDTGLKS